MAPKLEVLKGSGGSIKVGTTGTIGSLMTKELEMKFEPNTQITPRENHSTASVSVPCGVDDSSKTPLPTSTVKEASSSSSGGGNINYSSQSDRTQKTRRNTRKSSHHMPILTSDSATAENTPNRQKPNKKAPNIVEVVDIRCGYPNKWSNPIANRFKKLNPSKLSETIT